MKKPPLRQSRIYQQSTTLSVVEEATHLLRRAPVIAWLCYYIGSAPLAVYLFYFWNDMSRSGTAEFRLLESSLLLASLYGWMKTWQSVYCGHLMQVMEARNEPLKLTFGQWCRLIGSQVLIHATMPLILIPAAVALLPGAWVYAFYHNTTVLAMGHFAGGGNMRGLISKALAQSHYEAKHNHYLILIIKTLAVLIYANLLVAVITGLMLLKSIFGYETVFSMNPMIFISPGFQMMILIVAYLLINPWIKTLYTIRCFYGLSRRTGEDIRARIRQLPAIKPAASMMLVLGFFFVFSSGALSAQENSTRQERSQALDNSIKDVLTQSEYQWRMPRENNGVTESPSWIVGLIEEMAEWVTKFVSAIGNFIGDMIEKLFRRNVVDLDDSDAKYGEGWSALIPALMWTLAVILLGGLIWLIVHYWRQARKVEVIAADEAVPVIDLEADQVVASQLPVNEWMKLAREKANQGELRLAMRALFLATLAHLGEKRLLHIVKSKSNGDYLKELAWRARGRDELYLGFKEQVRIFDSIWYGWHEVNQNLMTQFEEQYEKITSHAG